MDKKDLIQFSKEIAELYDAGKIKSPVHLGGGNEDELIQLFKNVRPTDWIFCTWRSHYQWLLSGRSPSTLRQQIIDGHSMHIFGDKFFTSAIVGGIAPISVGVAAALKRKKSLDRVWCFLGDMGASTGIAMESIRYACGHELPVTFIIEDNGLSVKTDTKEAWGCTKCGDFFKCNVYANHTDCYSYKRKWPHAGTGVFVLF